MSSISAGAASPLTMEALVQLADFIRHPEYIDRIRELQAAQRAHDQAAQSAIDEQNAVNEAKHKLEVELREFETNKFTTFDRAAKAASDLKAKEAGIVSLSNDLIRQKNDMNAAQTDLNKRIKEHESSASAKTVELKARETAIKKREDELASWEARINRRLAKMREAEAI
jgi:peptidoglycan hydrolase CwlO-like protein